MSCVVLCEYEQTVFAASQSTGKRGVAQRSPLDDNGLNIDA